MLIQDFSSQLRVHHVDGTVIPPFQAPFATKLYKLIRLSIKNLLNFIIFNKINMHVIIRPFLAVCHHGTDIDFMCFCMSLENRP